MTLKCPICEREMKKIDSQHIKKHGLTVDEYKALYPDGPYGASPETKEKMSGENHRLHGKKRSPEECAAISAGTKKMWETYEPSEKQKETWAKTCFRNKDGTSVNLGRKHTRSEEYKQKLSDAILLSYRENPRPNTHFWFLRNEMCKWADYDEECNHHKFEFTCKTCHTSNTSSLRNMHAHKYGQTLCKVCYPNERTTSKAENEIRDFVISLGHIVQPNVKGLIGPAGEIDIYIPSLKIGIEFHGLYWHSFPQLVDTKRHRRKFEEAKKAGIRLIQIFSDEWAYKQDIVKSRIAQILRNQLSKIYARKCEVKVLRHSEVEQFLNENHLQGGGARTNKNYGLFYEGELVSLMTFTTPRKAMNHKAVEGVKTLELLRFANKRDVNVVGAASKLLAACVKNEKPDTIQSWADLRWVNPEKNLYTVLGFTLKSDSVIGYFYTDYNLRYHRYGFRKPSDCPKDVREGEYWAEKGFYQVYDAGQYLYELDCRGM